MNRRAAAQVFTFFAILIGLGVSYYPPIQNANAIWGLVGTFIGFAMHDLFDTPKDATP
jgi:hypothetical protein